MNEIELNPEYLGKVWAGKAKLVKQLETLQITVAKKILEGSRTTSDTVLKAALEVYLIETNGDEIEGEI